MQTPPSETSPLIDDVNGTVERRDSVDEGRAAQFAGDSDAIRLLKYIVPVVGIGVFLAAADQTIIVTSYGRIGSDLNALNLTSWIGTSYFLTLSSFQPLYGKLSDIFGRKICLLWAYVIFGLGCLFCGLAANINQLIAARVFQGIGGGGMTTVVSILLSDIIPLKDRGVWQGLINIVYASGAAAGAPLGGLISDFVGWRWAFLAQAPLCLVAFITAYFLINLPARDSSDWRKKLRRIDFSGAVVLLCAVFGLIFGLDRGSNVSWKAPITYGPLAASVVFFSLFMYVEMKVASEPFAPGSIIFDRSMFASYLCNFFSFGAWLAALFYLPLFYQAVDGFSATGAAVRMIPQIISSVSGSLFGGFYMRQTGKLYWITVIGYTMLPLGLAVMVAFSGLIMNSTWAIVIGAMFCAFGNGIGVTTSLIALISNADPADQAIATACSYLFRSLGSVVGLSLCASLIQQSLRGQLAAALGSGKDAAKIEEGVRRSLEFIKTLDPEVRDVVRNCYGKAVGHGFMLMVIISLGSTVSSYFIREKRLSK